MAFAADQLLRGRYRLEKKIGGGGMGEVYLASFTDALGQPRRRAIKRLRMAATSQVDHEENLELFAEEARALARLSHPGIPEIYERFAQDGDYFIVMELIHGADTGRIRAKDRHGRLAPALGLHVLREVAEVLGYLHRQAPKPVVYRDLKPGNVMLTPANRVVMIDFGIARLGDHAVDGPADRPFYATPAYAAPEALQRYRTTPRSDIYSLGLTAAELLTGVDPEDLVREGVAAVCARELPAKFRWLAEVLGRAAAHDPYARFATGDELIDALDHALTGAAGGASRAPASDVACASCEEPLARGLLFCPACGDTVAVVPGEVVPADTPERIEARLTYAYEDAARLVARAASDRPPEDPDWVELALRGQALEAAADDGALLTVERLRFAPLPHQVSAARRAVIELRGRALLADEVGLGKTIESLMVFDELRLRGLVKHLLVLTPSTLTHQWIAELQEKFEVPPEQILELKRASDLERASEFLVAVGSYDALKVRSKREALAGARFDMLIVDEVQNLLSHARDKRRPKPLKGYELVANISKKFILLLSATPIQHSIVDLYEIVNLLRPGQLLHWDDFVAKFVARYEERKDGRRFPVLKEGAELKRLLEGVVIRNTRERVLQSARFPRRRAVRFAVELSAPERALYDDLRRAIAEATPGPRIGARLLDLAEALSSSPAAFCERAARGRTPKGLDLGDLPERAAALGATCAKVPAVREILRRFVRGEQRKAIVFARFPASRELLGEALAEEFEVLVYHRGIDNAQRVQLLRAFQRQGDVLIVDDSAAVGLNLQFCDLLLNFDLPWNPFLIEQRIGRVQRIGQCADDVIIANLEVTDTIDAFKLDVCQAKLRMFEGVFGSAPTVLGALQDRSIEDMFAELYLERDLARFEQKREAVSRELDAASREIDAEELLCEEVFDAIGWSS